MKRGRDAPQVRVRGVCPCCAGKPQRRSAVLDSCPVEADGVGGSDAESVQVVVALAALIPGGLVTVQELARAR